MQRTDLPDDARRHAPERRPSLAVSCLICHHTATLNVEAPEKRPQDPHLNGSGLQFETLEHGGEYPDAMPQAVRITDAEGRSCLYVPVTVKGRVVDSKRFTLEP
jgi:hypothetical protein